jgi:UDP-N-acetylmuramoyl-tripeptide--D-alanyl-D-alanine ligase
MGIRHAQFDKIIPQLSRLLDIKIYRGFKNVKILDDSYNSNPSGFFKAVDSLAKASKKRLVITPGIIELGSKSRQIHSVLGASLAKVADVIIVTNNNFYDDFKTKVDQKDKEKFWLVTDKVKTKNWLMKKINRNWVILLEGRVPYWVGQNLKKVK